MNDFLSQNKTEGFGDSVWQRYKESSEFATTARLIRSDIDYSKNFFEELFKKTKDVITHAAGIETNAEKKDTLNKFLSIIDKSFILDSKFKHTFKATLGEMINTLRPAV